MTKVESMVEPDGILNDFGRETVAFVQFWLSHELNTGRLSANLSVQFRVTSSRYLEHTHSGRSTGSRTVEGEAHQRAANTKQGNETRAIREERSFMPQ